jgi:TetR/AcrR family transcriptional regulator
MFAIWAVTQAYADLGPQFALLLGKKSLDKRDFAAAQQVIEAMVLSALDLRPASA